MDNDNSELFAILDALVGDKPPTNSVVNTTISHFSEYTTNENKLSASLLKAFNKHLTKPTAEEYAEYAIKKAKEDERIRIAVEEDMKRGPAFLSDEWRWARIDAEVDRCKEYIKTYG